MLLTSSACFGFSSTVACQAKSVQMRGSSKMALAGHAFTTTFVSLSLAVTKIEGTLGGCVCGDLEGPGPGDKPCSDKRSHLIQYHKS